MKKQLFFIVMLFTCVASNYAQSKKEQKAAAKQLKQEVENYTKEGWGVSPGHLPLSEQLSRSYSMQKEVDSDGFQKYVTGDGMSTGTNYDAAKMQALELAKIDLAQKLQSEIIANIENDLSNSQEEQDDAVSVAKTVLSSRNFIRQKLGRVITLVELYRVKPNKNKEVMVVIACNSKVAVEAAREEVRKQLEEQGKRLHEEINSMLSE